ncbi:MAG: hypothetical protein LKE51_10550 [Selenomonas sp.]|nr:hypothetical protein [Selenomonas sp.]
MGRDEFCVYDTGTGIYDIGPAGGLQYPRGSQCLQQYGAALAEPADCDGGCGSGRTAAAGIRSGPAGGVRLFLS